MTVFALVVLVAWTTKNTVIAFRSFGMNSFSK